MRKHRMRHRLMCSATIWAIGLNRLNAVPFRPERLSLPKRHFEVENQVFPLDRGQMFVIHARRRSIGT